MPREMEEGYIWAAQQGGGPGVVDDVTPWPEGETVMLGDIVADLLERVKKLEQKAGEK